MIKMAKLLVMVIAVVGMVYGMPHEPRIPGDIPSADIVFTDATLGQEMLVVVTKTQLQIYKLEKDDSYSLLLKKPVCQASALSVTQSGFLPSQNIHNTLYSVIVGCKDGYFNIYDVSLQRNYIIKEFSKKISQPVQQFLAASPFLMVSSFNNMYLFNLLKQKIVLELPIAGPLTKTFFSEQNKFIQILDQTSQIQIKLSNFQNLQINRKHLSIVTPFKLTQSRLLQSPINNNTQDGVCGDGTINTGQQCDDGNNVDGDGCTAACQLQFCGDSVVNNNGGQQCDDGNTVNNDGCTNCIKDCGNGVRQEPTEQCDDGNTIDGDGCSSTCITEQQAQTYPTALGVGLGVGAVAIAGVLVGSAAAPAAAGVASSLIGTQPVSLIAGQIAGQVAGQAAGQAGGQVAGQAVGQAAGQAAGQAGRAIGQGVGQGVGKALGRGINQGLALGKVF